MEKGIIKYLVILLTITVLINNSYALNGDDEKEPLFKKAVKYFYEKKFEMAELLFLDLVKKNPEKQPAYSYLGDIYLEKKKYDGALNYYRKSLELNPDNGEDYFRIGQIYYYKKQGDQAIKNFQKAYDINPKIKYSYFHIGLSYLMLLRDKQSTINNWEKYLDIAPEDPQYENIRRAIELLKDPNFVIPPAGSDISLAEALRLGGAILKKQEHRAKGKEEGNEKKKTKRKMEDIYRDDDL